MGNKHTSKERGRAFSIQSVLLLPHALMLYGSVVKSYLLVCPFNPLKG